MSERRQRGFALVTALVVAMLYFALMELMLVDSSRALAEAQRFRAQVTAAAMAESGAELAALHIVTGASSGTPSVDIEGGNAEGQSTQLGGGRFKLTGTGRSAGVVRQKATVIVEGAVVSPASSGELSSIRIDYTTHTP